jgi:hypothetical protein
MKGPDHDALHKWLEPFIVEVASLKSATTEQKAGDVLKEIQKRLHLYTQYFE